MSAVKIDYDEHDRRRHPRVALGLKGSMAFGPCAPRRTCVIVDISEGGVRLNIGLLLDPPERFGLSLQPRDIFQRECRVVWRTDYEIGAKFI
jgi:PilZ domain